MKEININKFILNYLINYFTYLSSPPFQLYVAIDNIFLFSLFSLFSL